MGSGQTSHQCKEGLGRSCSRVEGKYGKIVVSGRYHRAPRKIEDDYVVETTVLGTGYNGSVYQARSKSTNEMFAVKGFTLHGIVGEKMSELTNEVEIFLTLDHPHISRLVDVYECEKHLNLVMELMGGGELFARVLERKRFVEEDAAQAVYQMLLAVNYIHSKGIVHRDLKLENFLYESPDTNHLKLIDFGFSNIWEPNTKMALSCGTLAYVAPEVLAQSYTSQCDLWSLGVVTFILLMGYMPFSGGEEKQMKDIAAGDYKVKPECFKRVSTAGKEFLTSLLQVDPKKRLTAETALAHEWITTNEKRRVSQIHNSAGLPTGSDAVDDDTVSALREFAQASKFRRACMSLMAWSLTNEERAEVRQAFLDLDKNNKGTITLVELRTVLMDKFKVSDENFKEIFEALDTSHNEEIHYTEFLAAMVSHRIQLHDELLKNTFRRFDVDNSGYITVENLKQVLGDSFEGGEVEVIMKEADFTHDGRISLEEFMQYLKGNEVSDGQTEVAGKIIDKQLSKDGKNINRRLTKLDAKLDEGNSVPSKDPAGMGSMVNNKSASDGDGRRKGTAKKSSVCSLL